MTDHITIDRKVVEQVLEALGYGYDSARCAAAFDTIHNAETALRAALDAAKKVEPWEGAEEWEQLAYELCAEEHGEECCNDLLWSSGAIPEPWGERWLKYEGEAKRMISLVRKFAAPQPAIPDGWVELAKQVESGNFNQAHVIDLARRLRAAAPKKEGE